MNFCWSTLRVNNLDESIQFYTDIIELEVVNRFKTGPLEIAFLGRGETKIELICMDESNEINVGSDISWGFEIESVNNMMDFLKDKGIAIHEGPFQPNPNIRFFYIMDPNGLKIQFVETIKY